MSPIRTAMFVLAACAAFPAHPHAQSTPYLGTPAGIPGFIPPQNFDEGGSSVAYYIAGEFSRNGNYQEFRPTETVSLEKQEEAVQVGWFHPGSWIKYSYMAATPGEYDIYFTYRCGSFDTPRTLSFDFGRTEVVPVDFTFRFNDLNWSSLPKGERALVAQNLALDSGPGILTLTNSGNSDINLIGVEFELKAVGLRKNRAPGADKSVSGYGPLRIPGAFGMAGSDGKTGWIDVSGRHLRVTQPK